MLTNQDKTILIKRLPQVELSYEKKLHKKVYANVFMLVPKGEKAFLWLTYYKNKDICLIVTLTNNNSIKNINLHNLCFDSKLSYGTLIHGTTFDVGKVKHFSCEDIHYYQGLYINNYTFEEKLNIYKILFNTQLSQKYYSNRFIVPGLPIYCQNYNSAFEYINILPYKVYGIKYININSKHNVIGIEVIKEAVKSECVFKINATISPDIYNVYCNDDCNTPYNIALIPNYKKSVMMNGLFRTIKENINLDLLEESDDEEEFENTSFDKFVNLSKSVVMKCVYNKRFRKWEPMEVLSNNTKLSTIKELVLLERNV